MNRHSLVACLPLLMLVACGRAEPVEDLPSQEELTAAANAEAAKAVASEKTDAAESRNYVNVQRGFSIAFPLGWEKDGSVSMADGVVYRDPNGNADVRVSWQGNGEDQTLQQVVETVNSGLQSVDGDFIGENEYRGTANDGEGNNVALRLMRQPDGAIVTATFVYPEMASEQYQAMAEKILDGLRIFAPRAKTPEGASAAPPPANASGAAAAQ